MKKHYLAFIASGLALSFFDARAASAAPINNDEKQEPMINLVLEPENEDEQSAEDSSSNTIPDKVQYRADLENPNPLRKRTLKREFHQGAILPEGEDTLIDPGTDPEVYPDAEIIEKEPEVPLTPEGGLDL